MEKRTKLEETQDLLLECQQKLTQSTENWHEFLEQSSRFYKYDFANQLLIQAQNPQATACATYNQ